MIELRRDTRTGVGGARGPLLPAGIRLCLLVATLTAVVVCGAVPAAGDGEPVEGSAGIGLTIEEVVQPKVIGRLPPPWEPGSDGRLIGDVIHVSVSTNVPDWGLAVRLGLPGGRKLELRPEAVTCRLRDEGGTVIRDGVLEHDEVFVEGNGRRGTFEFFLEFVEDSEGKIATKHLDLLVEVEGLTRRER
jgi:hypothetical protein